MKTLYKILVNFALCLGLAVSTSQPISRTQAIAGASGLFAVHAIYEINAAYKRACNARKKTILSAQQAAKKKQHLQQTDPNKKQENLTPQAPQNELKPMTWKEFRSTTKYLKKYLRIKRLLASGLLLVTGSFVLLNNNTNQRTANTRGKYRNIMSERERTYYESYFTQQNLPVVDYNSLDPEQLRKADDFIDQRKNSSRAELWTQALDNWDDRDTRKQLEEDLFADFRRQMPDMLTDEAIQRCVERTIQETKTKRDAERPNLSAVNIPHATVEQQRTSQIPTPPKPAPGAQEPSTPKATPPVSTRTTQHPTPPASTPVIPLASRASMQSKTPVVPTPSSKPSAAVTPPAVSAAPMRQTQPPAPASTPITPPVVTEQEVPISHEERIEYMKKTFRSWADATIHSYLEKPENSKRIDTMIRTARESKEKIRQAISFGQDHLTQVAANQKKGAKRLHKTEKNLQETTQEIRTIIAPMCTIS